LRLVRNVDRHGAEVDHHGGESGGLAADRGPARRVLVRAVAAVREVFAGLPIALRVLYVASTLVSLLAFNQGDLNHTVGSSYAYLFGHVADFYSYNATYFGFNDYLPSVYVVFAAWMAPVKLLISPGAQNGGALSGYEVLWAKTLLLLVFLATVLILGRIARLAFAGRANAERHVRLAYLLSPFAAFAFNVIGQYDVIGVLFTLLGVHAYLRGRKWHFALFFAVAASFKYFALAAFAPLLLLRYKKFREIVPLSVIALSVIVVEAGVHLPDRAFREKTLFGLAGSKLAGEGGPSPLTTFIALVYLVMLFLLWRTQAPERWIAPVAIVACATAYGLLLVAVPWNPQWFILLSPFFALTIGLLQRPVRFLVWESAVFLAFIGYAVNLFPRNVDSTMVRGGALRSYLGDPRLLLSDVYPSSTTRALNAVVMLYLLSPVVFWLLEFVELRRSAAIGRPDATVPTPVWLARILTLPVAFTLPVFATLVVPQGWATSIDPGSPTLAMDRAETCRGIDHAYGEVSDQAPVIQQFTTTRPDLQALSVLVGTSGRSLEGSIVFTVRDSSGRVWGTSETDLGQVADNSLVYAVLEDPVGATATPPYSVEVGTRGVPGGSGFALWGSGSDCIADAQMTLDGAVQGGDLNLVLYFAQP